FTPNAGASVMIRVGHELNMPVLYHEMGTPYYLPPLETHYQRLAKVLPFCAEVAALSPSLAAQWRRKFPFLNSLSVLPLTSECPAQEPAGRQQARGFAPLVFGFAARMEEGKGPLLLLEAFAKVLEAGVPAYLRMVGTGPQLRKVRRRAKERGLLGRCDFISTWAGPLGRDSFLQSLDIFILPTLAEGT